MFFNDYFGGLFYMLYNITSLFIIPQAFLLMFFDGLHVSGIPSTHTRTHPHLIIVLFLWNFVYFIILLKPLCYFSLHWKDPCFETFSYCCPFLESCLPKSVTPSLYLCLSPTLTETPPLIMLSGIVLRFLTLPFPSPWIIIFLPKPLGYQTFYIYIYSFYYLIILSP